MGSSGPRHCLKLLVLCSRAFIITYWEILEELGGEMKGGREEMRGEDGEVRGGGE